MSTTVSAGPPVESLYSALEETVRALRPKEDLTPLRKAFELASELHRDQKRASGDPYMAHPLACAAS